MTSMRAGTVNLARLMAWDVRSTTVVAEVDSMKLDLIGFQETTETFEADLAKRLKGDWLVVSDNVNCPAFARADLFEPVEHNGKSSIKITMPGSVRNRYGSAALLKRKSDGFVFVFATIHPSNPSESSHSASDRLKEAESCWQQLVAWGVVDLPILLVGDMNDKEMPPKGLPGVFVKHGMIDVLAALGQKARIDRAFVKGFGVLSATVNDVPGSASDHDFGLFIVEPLEPPREVEAVKGVDVSSHQTGWKPGPKDEFVFVKSTQGTGYINPAAQDQLREARSLNLQIGHYHFLDKGNPVDQARYFVANTDVRAGDLLACDWEGDWKAGAHPSVDDAVKFKAEVKRLLPNNKIGTYCNVSDWTTTTIKADDFLWIAAPGVSKPGIKATWDFWQYSWDPLDQNVARFKDLPALKAWANQPPAPVVTPPENPIMHSTKWNADYVLWHGGYVTVKDAAILEAVQAEVASVWGTIRLSQGGLSSSEPKSASTHVGLAAWDIAVDGRSQSLVWLLCKALLRSGVVAFPRGYGDGMTPKHVHCVSQESISHAHKEAQDSLNSKLFGYLHKILGKRGAGLAGAKWRRYIGPDTTPERWVTSPYNPANISTDQQTYYVNVSVGSSLIGNDVDRKSIKTLERGASLQAVERVSRWGRSNVLAADGCYYAHSYLSLTPIEQQEKA